MDEHGAASEGWAASVLRELESAAEEFDDVIVADDALVLNGEEELEIDAGEADEGGFLLLRHDGEAAVEVGDEDLLEVTVGAIVGADAVQTELLGRRPWRVPKFRSDRPRASGESARICSMPSARSTRLTCPSCSVVGRRAPLGLWQKWLPRSV